MNCANASHTWVPWIRPRRLFAPVSTGTKDGRDMTAAQNLLGKAVASIIGKKEERAVASLFTPGGTHAMKGEFQGINNFEVVAFLVVLSENEEGTAA
jgi:hypothetical protein